MRDNFTYDYSTPLGSLLHCEGVATGGTGVGVGSEMAASGRVDACGWPAGAVGVGDWLELPSFGDGIQDWTIGTAAITAASAAGWMDSGFQLNRSGSGQGEIRPTEEGIGKMRQLADLLNEIEVKGGVYLGADELDFLAKFVSPFRTPN